MIESALQVCYKIHLQLSKNLYQEYSYLNGPKAKINLKLV
jgi:hypothetical protein